MAAVHHSDNVARLITARAQVTSNTVARCLDEDVGGVLFGFDVDAFGDMGRPPASWGSGQRPATLERFITKAADLAVANIRAAAGIEDPKPERYARRAAERTANRYIKDRDFDGVPRWFKDSEFVTRLATQLTEAAIDAWLQEARKPN